MYIKKDKDEISRIAFDGTVCLNCGKVLENTSYNRHKKVKVCNNNCRKELTKRIVKEGKRIAAVIKEKSKNNRKCRVCGVSCSPNYFYCAKHMPHRDYGDFSYF